VLVDIEGTISSLPHVVDTHYPFTRKHIAAYLKAHGDEPDIRKALADTRALARPDESELEALHRWIDDDAKAPPLKWLQGLVWIAGYESGELQGHIYPDALRALTDWRRAGIPVHIFSSGSVQCQVQFFQHCPDGDHRDFFTRHFDTDIGAKVDPFSYVRIAAALNLPTESIVFFSDNPRELEAARSRGVVVVQVLREGAVADGRFPSVDDIRAVTWGDQASDADARRSA
jgi:enolase-phosphatase E1